MIEYIYMIDTGDASVVCLLLLTKPSPVAIDAA